MNRKVITGLALLTLFVFAGAASATTFISIATGGTGGTYYPLGGGIAEIISRNVPELQVTSETGNASAANINLIGTHQIEMAMVQNDLAYWAARGMSPFKEKYDNQRVVASLYPEHVHCITLKGTGVEDILDIKGKRVSVGAPGSGVLGDVSAILNVAEMKFGDMETDFLDFNATTQRFKDGQLDVGFVVAGYPTSSIMDLATTHEVDLVSFNDRFMNDLVAKYPFFIKDVVPAGTYQGVDKDVPTPAVMAMLICDADLSDDVVYKFTKALWENIADLHKVHAKAKEITLETALDGVSVPVHAGAAKYYQEVGMSIPEIN
ncbi:MAG: TAXI family TRAP transporter solute-binding subunit [Synergistaceae bacterium]|nr:TAXI family TRAP transporter solute-binding subunit [Synergistota bacterium]NLM72069.1 TAXI family TRAP transporter solute-binding subunit [Synergistaceae bacterium]